MFSWLDYEENLKDTDKLNLIEIANKFVCTEHGLSIFGLFKEQ